MDEDVEKLAAKFHEVYQKEAMRQDDELKSIKYEDLPEQTKEFDRVLARHVLKAMDKVLWLNSRQKLIKFMLKGR